MTHPHPIGFLAPEHLNQADIERVDSNFIREGLLRARENTIKALHRIRSQLKEGMTEEDARKLALDIFSDLGVSKHWHKPNIRFGPGTALTFHDPLQTEYRLKANDPYYLDLGPVWPDSESELEYEGDYGDTFVFGTNLEAEKCAEGARSLFQKAKTLWQEGKITGESLYDFLRQESSKLGFELVENVDGHRLSEFPHQRHSKQKLSKVPFYPSSSLWILEFQINDPQKRFGAFFEDLLF